MTRDQEAALRKLSDPEIRRLVENDSSVDVEVLIHLDLPIRKLRRSPASLGGSYSGFTVAAGPVADASPAFEKFGVFLRSRSRGSPVPLRAAGAYAVTVPAHALLEIAGMPMVTTVAANHRRSIPSG